MNRGKLAHKSSYRRETVAWLKMLWAGAFHYLSRTTETYILDLKGDNLNLKYYRWVDPPFCSVINFDKQRYQTNF